MKAKYVEERYPPMVAHPQPWSHPRQLCISTVDDRFDITVEGDVGDAIMAYDARVHGILERLADAFDKAAPEAFKDFWYNKENHV